MKIKAPFHLCETIKPFVHGQSWKHRTIEVYSLQGKRHIGTDAMSALLGRPLKRGY